jgi:hypothetical protein
MQQTLVLHPCISRMCKNLPVIRAQSLTTLVSNTAIVVVDDTASLALVSWTMAMTAELMETVGDESMTAEDDA